MINIVLIVLISCLLGFIVILVLEGLRNKRNGYKDKLNEISNKSLEEDKLIVIKTNLGFDPYSYTKVSQLFSKLSERYNVNIFHYMVYNFINESNIPGGSSVSTALPIDVLYDLVNSISYRQKIIFKYH